MKTIKSILAATAILVTASCTSTYHAGKTDDVYYSTKDPVPSAPQTVQSEAPAQAPVQENYDNGNTNYDNSGYNQNGQNQQYDSQNNSNSNSTQYTDDQGNTYVTNNYNGDYYDYQYSSQIRRFYEPALGFGYYDPFFTNSYMYNYNPASWGVSIYLGYNWWAPSYFYTNPFCYGGWGFGIGYGYPFYGYGGYPGFGYGYGYPYYGYGGFNHGYYHGYNQGYWHGYNDGFYGGNPNPYYYNSFDATSYYYGPRGSTGSNSPRSGSQRSNAVSPLSYKYEDAISSGKITRSTGTETLPSSISRVKNNSNSISPSLKNDGLDKSRNNNSTAPQPASGVSRDKNKSANENAPALQGGPNTTTKPDPRQNNQNNGEISPSKQSTTNPDLRNNQNNSTISPSKQGTTNPDQRNTNQYKGTMSPSKQNSTNPDQRQNNQKNGTISPTPQPSNRPDQRQNPNQNTAPSQYNNNRYNQNKGENSNQRPNTQPNPRNNNKDFNELFENDANRKSNSNEERIQSAPRENNSRNYSPKNLQKESGQDEIRESKQERMESAPRQENRTPVFQPRNEPRQYNAPSSPGRSQPSSPSPQNSGGGGRRK